MAGGCSSRRLGERLCRHRSGAGYRQCIGCRIGYFRTGENPVSFDLYALSVCRHRDYRSHDFDGEGGRIDNGVLFMSGGKVRAVGGTETEIPAGTMQIDGTGKYVTPGIIDIHSHLGDYPTPSVAAHNDGNEATSPVTPQVWAEHSVWPQDPGFSRAMANGGITSLQILPGSANLFGGRAVTLKNVPARTVQAMKFPGAPMA